MCVRLCVCDCVCVCVVSERESVCVRECVSVREERRERESVCV